MNPSPNGQRWLGLVVVLQCLILLTLWLGGPAVAPARADGIPDAGAQQERIIDELKAVNGKLDKLTTLLSGGQMEVRVKNAEPAKDR